MTRIAETALQLCSAVMRATQRVEYWAVGDDGLGFGFGFDAIGDDVRIAVDWRARRVFQMTVDQSKPEAERWMVEAFDDDGDDGWIAAMERALAKLKPPEGTLALH
jgi:hypothetical protein